MPRSGEGQRNSITGIHRTQTLLYDGVLRCICINEYSPRLVTQGTPCVVVSLPALSEVIETRQPLVFHKSTCPLMLPRRIHSTLNMLKNDFA